MTFHGVLRAPAAIYFGAGQRFALPRIAARFGQRVFLCSDERLAADPELARLVPALREAGAAVAVFDRTIPELPLACIQEAARLARAFGPDVIVGVGGGSCLDIAKLVALSLSHGEDLSAFYGEYKVPGPVVPVVAIPTTAGTGSEVTPVAVLADPARDLKLGISSPYLIPSAAICDPELTLTCPPGLTAVTGADALTHAIEAFTAVKRAPAHTLAQQQVFIGKNMLSDVHAREAIAALARHLPKAVADGRDIAAREGVMYGAMAAGLAFANAGTAAAHAIQYPVGAATGTAHGIGVATLLPYVMEFNRPASVAEMVEIGTFFGVPAGDGDDAAAQAAIDAVADFLAGIGIPRSLRDLGVAGEQIGWLAEQAMLSARLVNNNPRPLDVGAVRRIVEAAHAGDRSRLRLS